MREAIPSACARIPEGGSAPSVDTIRSDHAEMQVCRHLEKHVEFINLRTVFRRSDVEFDEAIDCFFTGPLADAEVCWLAAERADSTGLQAKSVEPAVFRPGLSKPVRLKRGLNSTDMIDVLTDLFILRGAPAFIRSDNGPEFVAQAVRDWIAAVGAQTAYIEPGSPLSGHRHAMPWRAVRGKTDTAKASMGGYGMNCSMVKSSTASVRLRS